VILFLADTAVIVVAKWRPGGLSRCTASLMLWTTSYTTGRRRLRLLLGSRCSPPSPAATPLTPLRTSSSFQSTWPRRLRPRPRFRRNPGLRRGPSPSLNRRPPARPPRRRRDSWGRPTRTHSRRWRSFPPVTRRGGWWRSSSARAGPPPAAGPPRRSRARSRCCSGSTTRRGRWPGSRSTARRSVPGPPGLTTRDAPPTATR